MATWQLQEAKARLSELVRSAERDGPQEITVHGRPAAVVISALTYANLRGSVSLAAFMRESPLGRTTDLEFERDRSPVRKVRL